MKNQNKELQNLFEKIINERSERAFDELYTKYSKLLFSVIVSICLNSDEANDILHDVFIKIWNLDYSKLPGENYLGWIYSVTRNATYDYIRKKKKYENIDDYKNQIANNGIEDVIETIHLDYLLEDLLEQEKLIVVSKALKGVNHNEISKLLGIPASTVRWKYREALKKINVKMKG